MIFSFSEKYGLSFGFEKLLLDQKKDSIVV